MAEVNTGLNPWLGLTGTSYAHELVRQASRVASELVEQPTSGIPRVVSIIRKTETGAPNSALGIAATWVSVPGLEDLQATYFQPSTWDKERPANATEIVDAERSLLIADIPSAGGISADKILLTDKIRVDDPEFGVVDLAVTDVKPLRGTGLIHVECTYRRT
jgi:hypothetical protein